MTRIILCLTAMLAVSACTPGAVAAATWIGAAAGIGSTALTGIQVYQSQPQGGSNANVLPH